VGNLINYKKYKIKILLIDGSILVMSMLQHPIMMRMEYLQSAVSLVFFETLRKKNPVCGSSINTGVT
jgi:hypothetical protein